VSITSIDNLEEIKKAAAARLLPSGNYSPASGRVRQTPALDQVDIAA
jgi:hypothetical protein